MLLGVTGGIAAVKAPLLASALTQAGVLVDAVLTEGAQAFTTPLSLAALTGRRAFSPADLFAPDGDILHVRLAHEVDVAVVAPATATFLARLAHGEAVDLLLATLLGFQGPIILAPAMEEEMWQHPAVLANRRTLEQRGCTLVGPVKGRLASGAVGEGRLAEVEEILAAVLAAMRPKDLAGRRVMVTAGPTREHIDDVRYLTNASSGKMGFALARAARERGADVTLVVGPTDVTPPPGVTVQRVESAQEMLQAVEAAFPGTDIFVAAAAVADFRPAQRLAGKAPKGQVPGQVAVEPTPDVLQWAGAHKGDRRLVGFAAQVGMDEARALDKLAAKALDLVVLNDVAEAGAGFGADTNHVVILDGHGGREECRGSKLAVAHAVLDRITCL